MVNSSPPFSRPNSSGYVGWFEERVREALVDSRPDIPNSEVEAEFVVRRAAILAEGDWPPSMHPFPPSV